MISSCPEGYTDEHHLFGILEGKCVQVSTPQILCLVEMIIAGLNAVFSGIHILKTYQILKGKNRRSNNQLFNSFSGALKKFPVLGIMLSSNLSMLMNVVQFAMIYFLNVKLSSGSTTALIASIASFTVKVLRARIHFFGLQFHNGFADDLWTFFPISKKTRTFATKILNITGWTSTFIFAVLYIVLNQLPQRSPHRVWMSSLAFSLEVVALLPIMVMAMLLAWQVSNVLSEHFKDSKDESFHKDFTHVYSAGILMSVLMFCASLPAFSPLVTNYVVPLREILIIVISMNMVAAQGKMYTRREKFNKSKNDKLANEAAETTGKDNTSGKEKELLGTDKISSTIGNTSDNAGKGITSDG